MGLIKAFCVRVPVLCRWKDRVGSLQFCYTAGWHGYRRGSFGCASLLAGGGQDKHLNVIQDSFS